MTIDQFTIEQEEIDAIYYRIADERIHFASYRHMHFGTVSKMRLLEKFTSYGIYLSL